MKTKPFVYMLFEGDLGGLGNPEGYSEDLETLLQYSKKLHDAVTWFHGDLFVDADAAEEYFASQDHQGENCLWLTGERGQECVILRMFVIEDGQDPIQ